MKLLIVCLFGFLFQRVIAWDPCDLKPARARFTKISEIYLTNYQLYPRKYEQLICVGDEVLCEKYKVDVIICYNKDVEKGGINWYCDFKEISTEKGIVELNQKTNNITCETPLGEWKKVYLYENCCHDSAGHNGRNWKGIGISILMITLISCVIFSTVLFFSPELKDLVDDEKARKELISLDEIMNMNYYPKAFNGSFLKDNVLIFKDEFNNLVQSTINNRTLDKSILVKNISFNEWGASSSRYSISADFNYILIAYDSKHVYRHSSESKYRIISIKDEKSIPVQPDDVDPKTTTNTNDQPGLNFVNWSPKENALVFAYKNNLYFKSSINSKAQQVTQSTANDQKFGIPDWLYEEEIFSKDQAVWWSPNGNSFAYAKFDDSKVVNISFTWYGGFEENKPQYPPLISIPYPKTGRSNPTVTLFVNRINEDGSLVDKVEVKPPEDVPEENYLLTFTWINDTSAIAQWANRVQNESFFSQCNNLGTDQSNCEMNFNFRPSGYGWVDILNEPLIDQERSVYYIKMSSKQSDQFGSFKRLAQVKLNQLNTRGDVKILTSGLYEVVDLLALDTVRNEIYYSTTEQFQPANRQIVKLAIATGKSTCLTCKLNRNCLDYAAVISSEKNYWVVSCQGPIIPYVELRSLVDNELILTLENNSEISEILSKKYLPKIKRFSIPIANEKYNATVKMLLPPNLKEDHEIHKYPMLINTYAGPGSQVVKNNFIVNWGYYLVTNKNIIYTSIDGRGSGFQGDNLLFEVYRRLGTVEIEDQVAVANKLVKIFKFIDPKRVAFFGWSYGGYATSLALTIDKNDSIKCSISVAPTTDWLYYDSAYTERYMGLPTEEDNLAGYKNASLLNKVDKIKSNKLLLVHGSSDDNVHLQHSMLYIKELNQKNVLFQLQIYPDQDHGLVNVGKHVYKTFENFLLGSDCFNLNRPNEPQRKRTKNINNANKN